MKKEDMIEALKKLGYKMKDLEGLATKKLKELLAGKNEEPAKEAPPKEKKAKKKKEDKAEPKVEAPEAGICSYQPFCPVLSGELKLQAPKECCTGAEDCGLLSHPNKLGILEKYAIRKK